jgi:hypothetical protein
MLLLPREKLTKKRIDFFGSGALKKRLEYHRKLLIGVFGRKIENGQQCAKHLFLALVREANHVKK